MSRKSKLGCWGGHLANNSDKVLAKRENMNILGIKVNITDAAEIRQDVGKYTQYKLMKPLWGAMRQYKNQ